MREHPVLFKLTALKQTLDSLAPLDEKLDKAIRSKNLKLPEVAEDEDDAMDDEEEENFDDDQEEGEEELEDEEDLS